MKFTKFQLSNPKQSGFTLIEMIIYLAIVSIVLVSMSYLILDLIGGQSKSFANQETNQNLRFIVNTISQDVVSAQDFSLAAADTLVLAVPGDDITYNFDAGNLQLTRQVGANPPDRIHSTEVEVTGSFFSNNYTTRSRNVGVRFIVNYHNPSNLADFNASSTGSFSLELRGRR